jgi:putative membrane protein
VWLAIVAIAALLSLYDSPYPRLAPLQNLPTLAAVIGLGLALRRWPQPTSAVACLCVFLLLHTLGGRYIYSYVPYDAWAKAVGLPAPGELFGFRRNHYDRLVHFAFGLLIVHPLATALNRHWEVRRRLSLYVAAEFVFAASAAYEVFEWLLTIVMAGADADAYNGQQGDAWDPQKDMACAGLGALIAVAALAWRGRSRARTDGSSEPLDNG